MKKVSLSPRRTPSGKMTLDFGEELPDGAKVRLGVTTRRFGEILKGTSDLDSDQVREKLRRSFGKAGEKIAYLHQVHSGRVVTLYHTNLAAPIAGGDLCVDAADGMITAENDTRLMVLSADCLPIYAIVPSEPSFIAILHAGWRGSEAGIARSLIRRLKELSGLDPRFYYVHLGPAIRSCCYEVGRDFLGRFPRASFRASSGSDPGVFLDLVEENKRQLLEEGVSDGRIQDWGLCTSCHEKEFYSHRRDHGSTGRMISWIVKTA